MMRVLASLMAWAMLVQLVPAVYGDGRIENQIRELPRGTQIEVRLKYGHRIRGTKGAEGERSFLLFDERSAERTIAYDDVARVKEIQVGPSRKAAYIWTAVAIGIAAGVGIAMAVHYADLCKSLSCVGK